MASNALATPRRSKTMPTEGHMTRFLYAILKQLDLKTIDWSLVATELDISNGHAARMRYSRFRQQMEGTISVPRNNPKPKKTTGKSDSGKGDSCKGGKTGKCGDSSDKSKKLGNNSSKGNGSGSGSGNGKGTVNMDQNPKKRPAPDDFFRQETADFNTFMRREPTVDSMSNAFQYPMPNRMALNGMIPASNNGLPFMPMQYPIPPSPPPALTVNPEDIMLNQSFAPSNSHTYNTDSCFGNTPNWNQTTDFCFSGCCQPYYPSTPTMYPSYPTNYSAPSSGTQFQSQQNQQQLQLQQQQVQPQQTQPRPLQPQNIWVPVKQEGGMGGASDDVLVKVEAATDIGV